MSIGSEKINIKKQIGNGKEVDDKEDNSDDKEDKMEKSEEGIDKSRRKFVKSLLAGGGVAATGAMGLAAYKNRDKIFKMVNNLLETLPPEAQKEADLLLKEYMSGVETVDLGRIFDIYFLRAQQKIDLGKNAEEIKILVDNYKKEVIEIGHDNFNKLTTDKDAIVILVEHSRECAVEIAVTTSLKEAFLEHISHEEPYEKDSSSVLDPMINSSFQCRSGTDVLTWLMLANKELFSNVTIVQIQTSGHVLAGFVSKSGDVYGIETIVEDDGVSSFGNITDLKKDRFPMNIVSAKDYFINAAVKPYKLLKPEDYFLLKNMKDGEGGEGRDGDIRAISSFGGFGKSDVTSGRKALKKSRVIHPESYSSKSSSFSEREYRGKLQVYEIKPLSAYEESVIDLFSVEEQTNMREYFNGTQQLLSLWNMCIEAINNDNVTKNEEGKILEAYLGFFRENPDIERKYDKVITAISRYNKTKSTEIGRIQFTHNSPRRRYNYAKQLLRRRRK